MSYGTIGFKLGNFVVLYYQVCVDNNFIFLHLCAPCQQTGITLLHNKYTVSTIFSIIMVHTLNTSQSCVTSLMIYLEQTF